MRALVLVSDAFGGRGGIALYNRHFLRALCSHSELQEVVAVPRVINYDVEEMPKNLVYDFSASRNVFCFLWACLKQLRRGRDYKFIICGHLHLLPVAFFLKFFFRCPVIPLTYGVEAWTPTSRKLTNYLASKIEKFITIRKLTGSRFQKWANIPSSSFLYLPNCIDDTAYGIGAKRDDLIEKYDIQGSCVVMSAGRLDSGNIDKNKGFDEMLELIPELRRTLPSLKYLIVGDGDDKGRLQQKAVDLEIDHLVIFAGYIPENQKADHYRLADIFFMAGSNPIFDTYPFRFVFLEALACGIPVVGCRLTDENERNDYLANKLVFQVDPNNPADIIRGILDALEFGAGFKEGINQFYYSTFENTLHEYIDRELMSSQR